LSESPSFLAFSKTKAFSAIFLASASSLFARHHLLWTASKYLKTLSAQAIRCRPLLNQTFLQGSHALECNSPTGNRPSGGIIAGYLMASLYGGNAPSNNWLTDNTRPIAGV